MTGLNFWWKKYQAIKELLKEANVLKKGETVEECVGRLAWREHYFKGQ